MKTKLLATTIVATLLLAILPSTYAFMGFGEKKTEAKSFGNREVIQTAIENGDYASFAEASKQTTLSEEDFNKMVETKKAREAQREAIQNALTSGDYETWKNLHQKQFDEQFTQANFDLKVEMNKAMEAKDYAKIKELRAKMGDGGMGMMGGEFKGKRGKFGGKNKGMFGGGDREENNN